MYIFIHIHYHDSAGPNAAYVKHMKGDTNINMEIV